MYHSDIDIKEGAYFISDVHFSVKRPHLFSFLESVEAAKLKPTQIFFMGDIFDALFGNILATVRKNHDLIVLINKLATKMEIYYLEGNHDFNLQNLFPNVRVFPISKQPIRCKYNGTDVLLAHGDFDGGFGYRLYTAFIRNRAVLMVLNLFHKKILEKLDSHLGKKDDCKEIENFEQIVKRRIEMHYDCKYFIEGHFHQNKSYELININYINLGAFACNQRYFIVKSSQDNLLLEEKFFS